MFDLARLTSSLWLGQKEDLWKAAITSNGGEAVDLSGLDEQEKK